MTATTLRTACIVGYTVGLAFTSLAAAAESLAARLTMMPIDEVNRGIVTGSGSAAAELDGNTLKISGQFSGLRGPATVARLHRSPDRGIRGAALLDLEVTPAVDGEVSGQIELTAEQRELLLAGRLYIQIHSTSAPEGNLWGWLLN